MTTKTRWDDILPLEVPKAFIISSDAVPSLFIVKWLSSCSVSHHQEANFMYSYIVALVKMPGQSCSFFIITFSLNAFFL